MGVDGLIKFLQSIISKEHLSSFKDKRAAVDMMSWIYRACYNAAEPMRTEPQSSAFLYFIHQMLDLLQHYNIQPICVFDGRFVPGKQNTVNKRRNVREQNYKKSKELLEKGQQEQSKKYLNRCISINEHIITTTMRALKGRGIRYMVAPYEADAQMAKLYNLSLVDFVICEDSDLIVYGIPVLLKLSNEGDCDYFDINNVNVEEVEIVFVKQFVQMDKIKRTEVAILAGTDYLPSIRGIGIKRAVKFMLDNDNIGQAIQKIKLVDKFSSLVPENYQTKAQQAKIIFLLATAYNPMKQSLELLDQNFADQVISEEMTIQKLRQIVGSFYEYDEQVCNGIKNVWTFEKRELSAIPFDGVPVIKDSVLRQKQMSLQNSKILKRLNSSNSTIVLQSLEMKEELIEMCESRQIKQKKQLLQKLQQQSDEIEGHHQSSSQKQFEQNPICEILGDEKMRQFKQKFPDWMKYSPRKQ